MKKLIIAVLLLFALPLHAAPIARPLGDIIRDFIGGGPNAGDGVFDTGFQGVMPTDTDLTGDDTDFLMVFELAGNALANEFGLYLLRPDNTVALTGKVFDGAASGLPGIPATATVSWDFLTGLVTTDFGVSDFSEVIKDNLAGWELGAYLGGPGGMFYSHDFLNPGSVRQVGIFDVSGVSGVLGDVAFAWEDLPNGGDGDYNDMLVYATDLQPMPRIEQIPEPGTIGLFGLAGLMLYGVRRKVKAGEGAVMANTQCPC